MTMFMLRVTSKVLIYVRCNWHVPGLDTTAVPDTTQKGDICSVQHCEDIKNLLQDQDHRVVVLPLWCHILQFCFLHSSAKISMQYHLFLFSMPPLYTFLLSISCSSSFNTINDNKILSRFIDTARFFFMLIFLHA